MVGALAFLLTSVLCALSPSGLLLVGLRLVQGLVAGSGIAAGRAVVSDRWTGSEAAAMFGTLAAITLIGPVIAPAIGGVILTLASWRAVFVFLAALGAVMAVATTVFRALIVRRGALALRAMGLWVSASAAVALVVVAVAGGRVPPLAPVWVLLAVAVAGTGLVIPATTVLAQEAGRRSAGTAASLSGGLSFLVGALATPLTGVTGQQSVLVMSLMMAALLVGAVLASKVTAV